MIVIGKNIEKNIARLINITAVTVVKAGNNSLTNELPIFIDKITVTSDYTYTPAKNIGGSLCVLNCYNQTDGAVVKCTVSSNVITLGNGQTLSAEECYLIYTYM